MKKFIFQQVHELYWKYDINCARTTLTCLASCFNMKLKEETLNATIGLHGAGGYRAQCGLVEGGLMFLGIYFHEREKTDVQIASICYDYADEFTKKFGSLKCYVLRPNGFTDQDPPHACEALTCKAILFAYEFIQNIK